MSKLKDKRLIRLIAGEISPVIVVLLASFIELAHLANTAWLKIYLYNGDSLTLAVIRRSLARKEAILWVFTAQLNLFPEGPLYALSSLFGPSIRLSLVLNSVLNILLYYLLVRLIIKVMSKAPASRQRFYALMSTLLLILYMLLETQTDGVDQAMATYYLFTTYYYGLILCGLLAILISLIQLKSKDSLKSPKNLALSLVMILVTGLTVASDPLYIAQFMGTFMASFFILLIMKLISIRKYVYLTLAQLVSLGLGVLVRHLARDFIGQTLNAHLGTSGQSINVYGSLLYVLGSLAPKNPSVALKVRIVLSIVVYYFSLFAALIIANRKLKGKLKKIDKLSFFVLTFVALQPIIIVVLVSALGAAQNRYFITPIITPLLGLCVLVNYEPINRLWHYRDRILAVLLAVVVIFGIFSATKLQPLVSSNYPDDSCLAKALDYKPLDGVGDYWTSRSLDVYNQYNERVLQISNFSPFAWLDNLASYQDKHFTFIVLSGEDSNYYKSISPSVYKQIGKPSKFNACPDFGVYQYYPGTPGYKFLNSNIDAALSHELKDRAAGKIALDNYTPLYRLQRQLKTNIKAP